MWGTCAWTARRRWRHSMPSMSRCGSISISFNPCCISARKPWSMARYTANGMRHGLKEIVIEPHLLIEGIECRHLRRAVQAQVPHILAHQRVVLLLHDEQMWLYYNLFQP